METVDSKYIYKNELYALYFKDTMGYGDFIDLLGRTASEKLYHKLFNIGKN